MVTALGGLFGSPAIGRVCGWSVGDRGARGQGEKTERALPETYRGHRGIWRDGVVSSAEGRRGAVATRWRVAAWAGSHETARSGLSDRV
jgi:hypothetical protein